MSEERSDLTERPREEEAEKAVLVSVLWGDVPEVEAEESLSELRSLAETAGAVVVDSLVQSRRKPDAATLLGKGKLQELQRRVSESGADLVIFDQELTSSQQRNLENALDIKVVDRTALILDIFAQHAHSKEGKAQVEMAQLRYQLTRLTGKGAQLSRLGGGIGTRGPGETKLEVDRRRINMRLRTLNRELRELTRVRRVKRKRRLRLEIPTFSLVGYTNAGKSSLLNLLTDAGVLVEDGLFSTLDPTTRRLMLPGNRRAVITDTVGFINHLPHQLVEAFKSTLEEVREADVLLHVIDASAPNIERRTRAVEEVLEELGALDIPTIYVLNKIDLLDGEAREYLRKRYPEGVLTSTVTGEGIPELKERMAACIPASRTMRLKLPLEEGRLLSLLYRRGKVLELGSRDGFYHLLAEVPPELAERLRAFKEEEDA
ncbi:GTPase HflX [Candidatus Solincola tengchongensis]|uniref:GTPase HflX n=1 Tax=Candidatus Solincola tengchongensis TaxID=2900693 RepID=UPI00257B08C0|nr:GTPase HflX [Candidatus Solincola tengchongensis]